MKRNYEETRNMEEALYNGELHSRFILKHLQEWIEDGEPNVIRCAAHGCYLTNKSRLLSLIVSKLLYVVTIGDIFEASEKYKKFSTSDDLEHQMNTIGASIFGSYDEMKEFLNITIIMRCKDALCFAIRYLQQLDRKFNRKSSILETASKSNERDVRLYCAYALDDYLPLYLTGDERIRKVINYREMLKYKWENEYTDEQKDFINSLCNEIVSGNISLCNLLMFCKEGFFDGHYQGSVFENNHTPRDNYDEDLWYIRSSS